MRCDTVVVAAAWAMLAGWGGRSSASWTRRSSIGWELGVTLLPGRQLTGRTSGGSFPSLGMPLAAAAHERSVVSDALRAASLSGWCAPSGVPMKDGPSSRRGGGFNTLPGLPRTALWGWLGGKAGGAGGWEKAFGWGLKAGGESGTRRPNAVAFSSSSMSVSGWMTRLDGVVGTLSFSPELVIKLSSSLPVSSSNSSWLL